jgi:hypothetical protein
MGSGQRTDPPAHRAPGTSEGNLPDMNSTMKSRSTAAAAVAVGAALVVGLGSATAVAGGLIGSPDIENGSIRSADIQNGTIRTFDLAEQARESLKGERGAPGPAGAPGEQGEQGEKGPQGPKGDTGLEDAYYSVAFYNAGDTNAGAVATVACKAQTDTAISGGVQVLGLDEGANARNTPVSSSFPGRMDWSTNMPRPGRLDGWIVQFGGNAGAVSDVAPEKAKVWALCVPGLEVPVEQTFTQAG